MKLKDMFLVWRNIVILCHVYADVRPRWLEGFPHHRQRGRGDDIMGADAEWTLQSIHMNFVHLEHRVPMAQVEDLPKDMQHQVVGVPWAWVGVFFWLAKVVFIFVWPCSIFWWLRSPNFVYDTYVLWHHFLDINEIFFMMINFIYIYTCVKCIFVICLWSMKQMPI